MGILGSLFGKPDNEDPATVKRWFRAVHKQDVHRVETMLQQGFDVGAQDPHGRTALDYYVLEHLSYLLGPLFQAAGDRLADPEVLHPDSLVEGMRKLHTNPVMHAARKGAWLNGQSEKGSNLLLVMLEENLPINLSQHRESFMEIMQAGVDPHVANHAGQSAYTWLSQHAGEHRFYEWLGEIDRTWPQVQATLLQRATPPSCAPSRRPRL